MNASPTIFVSLFLVSAAIGVFASLTKRGVLFAVFKPLTTILLLPVVGWPQTTSAWLVVVGILFSLGGDAALLWPTQKAFMVGLVLFLVAHLTYSAAFVRAWLVSSGGGSSSSLALPLVTALAMAAVTTVLVRALWSGAAGMRGPLVVYAAAIALMVVSAFAALGTSPEPNLPGRMVAVWAPAGAVLFYLSDSSLALDRFRRPIKFAPLLTLGLYWLGQLGIALSARILNGG